MKALYVQNVTKFDAVLYNLFGLEGFNHIEAIFKEMNLDRAKMSHHVHVSAEYVMIENKSPRIGECPKLYLRSEIEKAFGSIDTLVNVLIFQQQHESVSDQCYTTLDCLLSLGRVAEKLSGDRELMLANFFNKEGDIVISGNGDTPSARGF